MVGFFFFFFHSFDFHLLLFSAWFVNFSTLFMFLIWSCFEVSPLYKAMKTSGFKLAQTGKVHCHWIRTWVWISSTPKTNWWLALIIWRNPHRVKARGSNLSYVLKISMKKKCRVFFFLKQNDPCVYLSERRPMCLFLLLSLNWVVMHKVCALIVWLCVCYLM